MTEVDLFSKIKRNLPKVDFCRIENSAGTGMFDVNACYRGVEFWLELKVDRRPKLRASQVAWGTRRHATGGLLFILCHHPIHPAMSVYVPPFLNLVPMPLSYNKLMDLPYHVENGRFDWEKLLKIFTKSVDGTDIIV